MIDKSAGYLWKYITSYHSILLWKIRLITFAISMRNPCKTKLNFSRKYDEALVDITINQSGLFLIVPRKHVVEVKDSPRTVECLPLFSIWAILTLCVNFSDSNA